jgi:hypothetical protein
MVAVLTKPESRSSGEPFVIHSWLYAVWARTSPAQTPKSNQRTTDEGERSHHEIRPPGRAGNGRIPALS